MTDTPFKDRVALVTGASSGIGAAIARGLADRGAAVAGLARRVGRVAELGDGVTPVVADVTDPASLTAALDRVTQELGGPDLVVANAGVAYASAVDDIQPSDWQRQVDVNVSGVVATATAAIPHLVAAAAEGRPADLVVISSVSDVVMFPSLAAYSATKAAVTALTRGLRPDLVVRGVRTLNVRPGLVATEIAGGLPDEVLAGLDGITPLEPVDVADAVLAALATPPHVNISELTIMPTSQPATV